MRKRNRFVSILKNITKKPNDNHMSILKNISRKPIDNHMSIKFALNVALRFLELYVTIICLRINLSQAIPSIYAWLHQNAFHVSESYRPLADISNFWFKVDNANISAQQIIYCSTPTIDGEPKTLTADSLWVSTAQRYSYNWSYYSPIGR